MSDPEPWLPPEHLPRWVWKAVAIFWLGYILSIVTRSVWSSLSALFILLLVALFLSLAIEPGVNRLAARGWRIGTLVGQQIAALLGDSEKYVNRTVNFLNDKFDTHINPTQVIASINDPDGAVQRFIRSQQGKVVDLSVAALGVLVKALSVMLFTFYLVADGPKLRRAICSRLRPDRQRRVLLGWELAIDKTGGYLYSRALLAGLSAFFHWVLFQAIGIQAPVAMALWVGLISQFLPVVGTYIAGALPVVVQFVDSPPKALIILIFVILYQQVENYVLLPRITARTMDLHPAIAFGSAIAGGAVLGAVGAVLAIPAAAMAQAVLSNIGDRHEVIDSHLTSTDPTRHLHLSRRKRRAATTVTDADP